MLADVLLALALNRATDPLALTHILTWYEGTSLFRENASLPLASQSLSLILEKVGESNIPERFCGALMAKVKPSGTFLYDITSLSSYSRNIEILEYGYNRDGLNLPQVNLSMVVDKSSGTPVLYDLYPGSIVDVTTLSRTLKRLTGISSCTLVLDRGFFSSDNIHDLESKELSYIIPASFQLKEVQSAMTSLAGKLADPNAIKMHNGELLFVMPEVLTIGDHPVKGYCYYNPQREKSEQELFYKRLYEIKHAIMGITRLRGLKRRIEGIAKDYLNYLEWNVEGHTITVRFRPNAVSQRVNRMGKFVILYRGDFSWEECLSTYRSKDMIEKSFDILKNDLELHTPQVRKEETFRGFLFVCFLSLVLRMRLLHKMQESKLSGKYSLTELLTELHKLKMVELSNGEYLVTEKTKTQKDILSRLNCCA